MHLGLQEVSVIYDWNDPQRIFSWYMVWPERHGPELRWMAEMFPQWRLAIRDAWVLINEADGLRPGSIKAGWSPAVQPGRPQARSASLPDTEWLPVEDEDLAEAC